VAVQKDGQFPGHRNDGFPLGDLAASFRPRQSSAPEISVPTANATRPRSTRANHRRIAGAVGGIRVSSVQDRAPECQQRDTETSEVSEESEDTGTCSYVAHVPRTRFQPLRARGID
jgi:hypothetical protein